MRTSRVVLAAAGIAAAAVTTSAFTASNDVTGVTHNVAGYGEVTATGATVTDISYVPQASNNTYLYQVKFTTSTDVTGQTATLTLKSGTTPVTVGASSAKFVTCSNGAYTSSAMVITCNIATDTVPFTGFDTVGLTVVD
jgi:hypothetical protein